MKNSTITSVAERAGVSVATVSRVLTGKGTVSKSTKQRVLQAAQQLNYRDGTLPSSVRRQKSGLVLVLVPRLANAFYTSIIDGIQCVLREYDYKLMLGQTLADSIKTRSYLNYLLNGMVDGIIMMDYTIDQTMLKGTEEIRQRIVQCCEMNAEVECSYVTIDDIAASTQAVNYLISTGRKRIALMNSSMKFKYARGRLQGYRDALESAGIPVDQALITNVPDIDFNVAYSSADQLLELPDRPDAVFCVSDTYAAAVIKCATRKGLSIPADLAVVGFDNTDIASMIEPAITTVHQPRYQMGELSCRLLMNQIENEDAPVVKQVLKTELIVRDST